ncbi:MAG: metalloregulator ArsR/SmtB family transcription factor [Erysipelotrichaceae bacterium]
MEERDFHHNEIVKGKEQLNSISCLSNLANLYKVFGDNTRIQILYLLLDNQLCVNAIVQILEKEQSAISHQLKVLKEYDLIAGKKDGKHTIYYLKDDHVKTIIKQGLEHIQERGQDESI